MLNGKLMSSSVSDSIAAHMVILDGPNNGYRNLIVPVAIQDPLVQKAVSAIAGFHLWRNIPELRSAADIARHTVIQEMKEASLEPRASKVFSVSTWITLLVLLVGELILGGDDYIYLLRMMCLLRANGVQDARPEMLSFLNTQTDT